MIVPIDHNILDNDNANGGSNPNLRKNLMQYSVNELYIASNKIHIIPSRK